jgi:hypothetical protein
MHDAGGYGDDAGVAAPGLQRLRDESLVVSRVAVIEAIRIGGVEQGDAGVERRMDDGNCAHRVARFDG